jgi:hypothetical protein
MNYQKNYENIIAKAQLQNRFKHNGTYYEEHHINPKCLNGNDDKENKVLLTAKEHFICHKLLTYIYPHNRKIVLTFHLMTCMNKRKYDVSSRNYVYARELISVTPISEETKRKISESHKGKISPNKGNHYSIETKNKISESQKGKIPINKGQIGIFHHLDDTKQKMSKNSIGKLNHFYGKKHTEETKRKISKSNIGKHNFLKNVQ